MRLLPAVFAGVIAGAALAGPVNAQEIDWKFVSASPPNTPWTAQIDRFIEAVAEESNGNVKITSYPGGQLGDEQDTIQQVVRGRIEMGGFSSTAGALIVPELDLISASFFFEGNEDHDCVLDNHMLEPYQELFAEKGLQLTQWSEVGWVHVQSKEPLLSPEDVKGYKVRIAPSKASETFWNALGANGVPLGIHEINPSLQTGLVDGLDLNTVFYVAAGVGKLAPHMTKTYHRHDAGVVVINKKLYDGLSDAAVAAIEATSQPPAQLRAEVRGMGDVLAGQFAEAGGQIHELTPEQRNAWKQAALPAQEALVESIGGDAERIWDLMQAGKEACGA
jgi:TRAP-type C4-dicarboxylate transport system substrate-binding protein